MSFVCLQCRRLGSSVVGLSGALRNFHISAAAEMPRRKPSPTKNAYIDVPKIAKPEAVAIDGEHGLWHFFKNKSALSTTEELEEFGMIIPGLYLPCLYIVISNWL